MERIIKLSERLDGEYDHQELFSDLIYRMAVQIPEPWGVEELGEYKRFVEYKIMAYESIPEYKESEKKQRSFMRNIIYRNEGILQQKVK